MDNKSIILWHFAVLNAVSDSECGRFFKEDILTKLTPTDINSVSYISGSALYIACSRKNIDIAKTFIDHGAKFDDERNKDEIDTVIKLLPYIIDGRKDILDINTRFSYEDTVLSYAATNNLRDDKGTLIVQQLFDHYKNQISSKTVYYALRATNDNSIDSAKIILQNSHGLEKDYFNDILDHYFTAGQHEIYSLTLSHVDKQRYDNVIHRQYFQITKGLKNHELADDNQEVEQCNRFLDIVEKHRTISSPEQLGQGLVADKMKLFENMNKQEQNSEHKDISEIRKGSVAEKIGKFSAEDNQRDDQESRAQPGTRVKDMVNKLEKESNKESSNQEKSYDGKKEVGKALSHVSVSQLKQKFEER